MNNWNLINKKALVIGGSQGLGKAIVRELAMLGAEVLFTARNEQDLLLALKEVQNENFLIHTLVADVTDEIHREALSNWITQNWRQLDILVNNVGINLRIPTIDHIADELIHGINVNMIAPFELSRLLFPLLAKAYSSSVINVASVAGCVDTENGSPDGMSRGGLIRMTKSLAAEWADAGIRVNAVLPWFTETSPKRGLLDQEEKFQKIIARLPSRRNAKLDEIAAAVAFLAMDKSAYITGQNLSVDGGASINIH